MHAFTVNVVLIDHARPRRIRIVAGDIGQIFEYKDYQARNKTCRKLEKKLAVQMRKAVQAAVDKVIDDMNDAIILELFPASAATQSSTAGNSPK